MEREEADVVMENGGVEGTREGTGRKNGIWQRKKRSSNQHDGMDPPIAHHHHHYHHYHHRVPYPMTDVAIPTHRNLLI